VRLTATEGGVTAYVTLPARLLATPPDGVGLYGSTINRLAGAVRLPIPVDGGISQVPAAAEPLVDGPTTVLPALSSRPAAPPEPEDDEVDSDVPAVAAPPLPEIPRAAPVSAAPVSAAPVSAAPVSAAPVSAAPVSAAPVSAAPVSAAPVSAVPVSAAPVSAVPMNGGPVNGVKRGPARAEDIIGAAARGTNGAPAPAAKGTRWWSRGGGGEAPAPAPKIPAQREPVTAGTSSAGLPIRVPLAQLPGDPNQPVSTSEDTQQVVTPHIEPDPASVGSMLTRFYSGVHRAANEDEVPTVPINEHRGSTA